MTHRVEQLSKDVTLYLGDCRDILPTLGKVDAVVTDPPYGVNLSGKVWHSTNRRKTVKSAVTYASYEDTANNFDAVVVPALQSALDLADCGLVFMADKSLWRLPQGVALGGIFSPAGTGLGSWGFQCFMHCVFYGRDPYLAAKKGSRPTGRYGLYANDANTIGHPCAKPIQAMEWAVGRASLEGAIILDPFMGSGTTGVACVQLGRKFIGIELELRYFDIAVKRISAELARPRLPLEEPRPLARQEAFDGL